MARWVKYYLLCPTTRERGHRSRRQASSRPSIQGVGRFYQENQGLAAHERLPVGLGGVLPAQSRAGLNGGIRS